MTASTERHGERRARAGLAPSRQGELDPRHRCAATFMPPRPARVMTGTERRGVDAVTLRP